MSKRLSISKRLRMVLSLLLICTMILPSNYVSAAADEQNNILVSKLSVGNLNYFDGFTIAPDSNQQIKMKITPNNATNKVLKWESSNKSVATVTDKGLIHGVAKGKAEITVFTTDGSNLTVKIPVIVGVPVLIVKASTQKVTMMEGEKVNVSAKVEPANATNKSLVWKSSNPKIASITSNGEITAVAKGKTSVYAVAMDGTNHKAIVSVTVKGTKVCQTLTDKDVVDGKITVKDKTLLDLTIDSSVGNAEITLDHVTVKGDLKMSNGAKYSVYAKDSKINNIIALEETIDAIRSFALNPEENNTTDSPTFVAEAGTLVVTVDARGNITVVQEGSATIGTVTINRTLDGRIELNLEGFNGNLVIDSESHSDITINTYSCNIAEATISGTSAGQHLSIQDYSPEGQQSTIDRINVETNAEIKIDVPVTELAIADSVEEANIIVEKPVERIINAGKDTVLTIKNDVTSIESSGEGLEMKVAAGSEVNEVVSSGAGTEIEVALGSTIMNIESSGDNSSISGSGTINTILVKGNDTVIENDTANISVDEDASGTKANGEELAGGTDNATPGSNDSYIPPIPPSDNKTKVTINDPGKVFAGKAVQLTSDMNDVTWSVYSRIDETYGIASIEENTGILHPELDGYVRIVATSNSNSAVYGAVDVMIYDKKFVKAIPLQPITIDGDQNLASIEDLVNANILPTKADFIYETGNGAETETISVDLPDNNWSGALTFNVAGTYNISNSYHVPDGYEYPSGVLNVDVTFNTEQTDLRKEVTGCEEISDIILTADEHLTDFYDVYYKYLDGETVTLNCSDGSTASGYIWFAVDDSTYNGEIAGTYTGEVYVEIPEGYYYTQLTASDFLVDWFKSKEIVVPVTIQVQELQSVENIEPDTMPDTTQPKFTIDNTIATINAVTLEGAPVQVTCGDRVDFSQYLTVDTNSELPSDKRVDWEMDGYYFTIGITGEVLFDYITTHTVTATSIVNRSKSASITVVVVPKAALTVEALAPITVSENLGIVDLPSLYTQLKDELPKYIDAVDSNNQPVKGFVTGWIYYNSTNTTMTIAPLIDWPTGYEYETGLPITIIFTAAQHLITGFNTYIDSNGAVDATYFNTLEEYMDTLPAIVTTTEGDEIPVLTWTPNESTSDFGLVPATYTFTATLDELPFGYTLADGVEATAQVTIAPTLSIESIEQFEDITLPLNYEQVQLDLPEYMDVTLSDGVTSYDWMPVTWDVSGFDATQEGTYEITGTMSKLNITNDMSLVPIITVIVQKDANAVLESLEIVALPNKLLYKQGEALDTTGLRIVENYSEGSAVEVVTGAAISAFDSSNIGFQELMVTYDDMSVNFNVYVDSLEIIDNTVLFVNLSTDTLEMEVVNVATGSAISYLPVEPERNGYAFNGWYSEENPVTTDTVPSGDMVAYAIWDVLDIVDCGFDDSIWGYVGYEYALYRNGIKLTLTAADTPNTFIINGNLCIEMYYAETGFCSFVVEDSEGQIYIMTIPVIAPDVTTAANTDIKVTLGDTEFNEYELGFDITSTDGLGIYAYDNDTYSFGITDYRLHIGMPVDTLPGTYRYLINNNGDWYKTTIVVE